MTFLEQIQPECNRLHIDILYLWEAERNTSRYRRLVNRLSGKVLDCEETLAKTPQDIKQVHITAIKNQLLQVQKRKKLAEELVNYWEKERRQEEQRVRGVVQAEMDREVIEKRLYNFQNTVI